MSRGARIVTAQGFGPDVWQPTVRHAPVLSLPRRMAGQRVLIAAAHADDETLGAAGLIQAMHRRGARFVVLVGTDGAAAFPGLDEARRRELVSARECETSAALHELGLREHDVTFLGLPDGAASDHHEQLAAALAAVGAGCCWWLAPWREDPHPDHQAVGRAAAQSLPSGTRLIEYPIWMRHSIRPGDPRVPRAALRTIRLNRGQRRRKLWRSTRTAARPRSGTRPTPPFCPATCSPCSVAVTSRSSRRPDDPEHIAGRAS